MQPNVLFILADQHNAKFLGHRNHPDAQTPHLDRLAAEGVRFENAVCQSPICTPSRISWISGQYCHNHGYYGLSGPNPRGLPTVLGHFRRAGYRTAAIGKIHCPEYWVEDDCDVFHETGTGTSRGGRSSEYAAYLEERNLVGLEDHGALNEFGRAGLQSAEGRPSAISYEDSREGWTARKGVEFMRQCVEQKKPFFVHVSMAKPHQCYAPAKQFWDLYGGKRLSLPPNADYDMKMKAPHMIASARKWREKPWQLFEPKTFEAGRLRKLRGYLGNISHVDHAVGELLNWLDGSGEAANTIVVYSSDHGEYVCEHGILEKAPGICSDAVTRVPMIWRWPAHFKANHSAAELVESVDFANTVCALAGLEKMETADGTDISHLLRGERGEVRTMAVTECAWSRSIRKGKYRFVYYPREMFAAEYPQGFGELYDLENDPWEMSNLFFDGGCARLVDEFRSELLDWLVTTSRPATILSAVNKTTAQSVLRYDNAVNADFKINPALVRAARGKNYI